ncbi:hypothetical protein BOW55_12580 [Flavobacterium sp. YO12]|nr:hypothetical protein BOW55_12580 [Flavobacterium sp. YO12]
MFLHYSKNKAQIYLNLFVIKKNIYAKRKIWHFWRYGFLLFASIFCFLKEKAKGFPLPSGLDRRNGFVFGILKKKYKRRKSQRDEIFIAKL